MENGFVKTEIKNNIGYINFGHPKSNSLPSTLLAELALKIREMGENEEINVIFLSSEGDKTFCAGASFDELLAIKDFETGKKFFMGFANVINAMRTVPQFVVTRIQGKAVGGGVGIAAASDYAMATSESAIKLSELALGIGPFVVGPAVERKIGKSAFGEMSIDYDWRDAYWAYKKGLFTEVFETVEELDEACSQLVVKLAGSSIEAMRELKKILWEGTENWDTLLEERAEISGNLVLSEFTKNYINGFKSKTKS